MTLDEIDEAVRRPAAKIKPGYQVTSARLRDGHTVRGFLRNRNLYSVQIQDLSGRFHLLKQDELAGTDSESGSPGCRHSRQATKTTGIWPPI